ncbi:MAG: hypothetical protein QOI29_3091, partial [Mycobacterium sp.]|nr:hypothetical protein [Mycobacterium sp.]
GQIAARRLRSRRGWIRRGTKDSDRVGRVGLDYERGRGSLCGRSVAAPGTLTGSPWVRGHRPSIDSGEKLFLWPMY